jgi:decaprenyl-phosphate phosphoribosyltransferase
MTTSPATADLGAVDPDDRAELPVQRSSLAKGLLRTARPKQWVKNILVLAAPAAAGRLFEGDIALQTIGAFVTFALASIGTYFANDAVDHPADRLHPTKRLRPIAAGIVPLPLAWVVAIVSLTLSLGSALVLSGWQLAALLAGYVTMTLSYSFWLKRVAVIELACVAAGFVLRMIAGGIATGIPISNWFLTVASFSSLFVVAGKRYAEVLEVGEGSHGSRKVLREYTVSFLRVAWAMALAVSVAAYCQWAFERTATTDTPIWYQLSAVPWVLALLRYALLLERGDGGAPEDVLLHDRVMLALGALWIGMFGLGIYVH